MMDKDVVDPDVFVESIRAMRQLVFKGLLAAAQASSTTEKAESAWKDFEEADANLLKVVNRIRPGAIKE